QAEDGIRDRNVTGVQTCALPICGARRAHAEVKRFVELIDSPLATTANGKGILAEDHPLSLGSNVRFPSVHAESADADVLIVLGSELAHSDLCGGLISAKSAVSVHDGDAGQRVIRCDIDPDQLNKNLPGDILACADASEFLTAVMAALETDRASSAHVTFASDDPARITSARATGGERTARIRQGWGSDFDFDSIGARVTRLVEQGAGPNVVIAGDSSQVTYDGTVHALSASTPDQLLYMPGFATLGYGIP